MKVADLAGELYGVARPELHAGDNELHGNVYQRGNLVVALRIGTVCRQPVMQFLHIHPSLAVSLAESEVDRVRARKRSEVCLYSRFEGCNLAAMLLSR